EGRARGPRLSPPSVRSDSGDCAADPLRLPAETRGKADEVEVEPADHDLVAVLELVPIHALAIQEDAVQAAVIQYSCAAVFAMKKGVAAGNSGVVEADVSREAPPDPRRHFLEPDTPNAF